MMTKKNEKEFDCLEFKHRVQLQIHEEIKDLSPQEEIEYFRKAAENGPFGRWRKRLKNLSAQAQQRSGK